MLKEKTSIRYEISKARAVTEYYKSLYDAARASQEIKDSVEQQLLMENYLLQSQIKILHMQLASAMLSEDALQKKLISELTSEMDMYKKYLKLAITAFNSFNESCKKIDYTTVKHKEFSKIIGTLKRIINPRFRKILDNVHIYDED